MVLKVFLAVDLPRRTSRPQDASTATYAVEVSSDSHELRRLAAWMSAVFGLVRSWIGAALQRRNHRPTGRPERRADTPIAWRARRLQWANGRRKPLTCWGGIGTFGAHRFARCLAPLVRQIKWRSEPRSRKGPEIERPVAPVANPTLICGVRSAGPVELRCVRGRKPGKS